MSKASISLEDFIEQVIDGGIEYSRDTYKTIECRNPNKNIEKEKLAFAGLINGYETCRGKAPLKLIPIWQFTAKKAFNSAQHSLNSYWFWRHRSDAIAHVLNSITCFLELNGAAFPWDVTSNLAYLAVAKILGFTGVDTPSDK